MYIYSGLITTLKNRKMRLKTTTITLAELS